MTTSINAAVQAHQQYNSSGKLSPALLRQPIFRAWERSHLLGVSPRRFRPIQLEPLETERLLDKHHQIITTAKPYLRVLSRAAGNEYHAAMLGDARAIMLDIIGDDHTLHGPEPVAPPGSVLDESACGPNGFGTAIAEGSYVEIIGPEHFIEGFCPFTCQGIPVRNPEGEIIGCITLVVKRPEAGDRLREILVCAAHGMEMELMRARLERDIEHIATVPELSDALLENLRQDVTQALAAARIKMELAARDLGRHRTQYVSYLLELASRSMAVFRKQGLLWQNLISSDASPAGDFELSARMGDLVELLETERRTAMITLDATSILEPVTVMAAPRETNRALFRAFLRAFEVARGGGAIKVAVRRTFDGHGEAYFEAIPAMGSIASGTTIITVKRPLFRTLFPAATEEDVNDEQT
jgi:transcriptional regulator of acetoin/glycerol metabolism